LQSLPVPKRPYAEISLDLITGLPPIVDRDGGEKNAILVVVDRYTKMNRFFAVNTTLTSYELADLLHQEIELRNSGAFEGIVSDRGSIFTSQFWSDLCYLTKVKRRLSTAFHPQTDGQTERSNQVLEHYLRCYTADNQANWPRLLKEAEFACNIQRNATTKMSPFEALQGFTPEFHDRIGDDSTGGRNAPIPTALERVQKLKELRAKLERNYGEALATQKRYYDKRRQELQLNRGDLVALSTKDLRFKESRKLAPRFIGPFRILERVGSLAYRLAFPAKYSRLHDVISVARLEPWHPRPGQEELPMPDLAEDDQYEVEEVQKEELFHGERHFLVKWKGWPSEYNQWVAEEDAQGAKRKIQEYRRDYEHQAKRRRKMPEAAD